MRKLATIAAAAALLLCAAPATARRSTPRQRAETRMARAVSERWWSVIRDRFVRAHCQGRGSRWNCRYDVWAGWDDGYRCGYEGRRNCPEIVFRGTGWIRGSRVHANRPYRVSINLY